MGQPACWATQPPCNVTGEHCVRLAKTTGNLNKELSETHLEECLTRKEMRLA